MSKIGLTVEQINAMEPTVIVRNDNVRDKFIQIYEAMWTPSTGTSGEAAYERESRNFNRLLSEKEDMRKTCTKFSLFTAFLDVAISGLTLDPGTKAQAYLLARSVAVDSYYDNGQKKNKYETHCMLTVSGYGELVLRARCGQIRHADNPVIVYEEDSFEYGERDGQKFVNYTCRLPHTTGRIVACFMKITLDPGTKAQAYLLARSVAVDSYYDNGQKKNKYETHCMLTVSGYGELVLRARCGQIRHADNPVIVYEEDSFEYGERDGQKFVNYTCRLPHTTGRIVACFMKITRADGSIDYAVMLPEDWIRLSSYSARQNGKWNYQTKQWENGKPNALYEAQGGQIDPGFLVAKCIKHAFKTYPKARVGRATQLESQQVDETEITDDIYGVTGDGEKVDTTTGEIIQEKQDFAPQTDTSAGVTVDPAANDDDDTF